MIRYALNKETGDRWSIEFQPTCERTLPTWEKPLGEGLQELTERLAKYNYDLVEEKELDMYLGRNNV
jgi:hypothetical protein